MSRRFRISLWVFFIILTSSSIAVSGVCDIKRKVNLKKFVNIIIHMITSVIKQLTHQLPYQMDQLGDSMVSRGEG